MHNTPAPRKRYLVWSVVLTACFGACMSGSTDKDGSDTGSDDTGEDIVGPRETLWDRFPLDGARAWDFVNDDASVDFALAVEKTGETAIECKNVVTLTYTAVDSDGNSTPLYAVDWSSDAEDGIQIWGWMDFTSDPTAYTPFSPPIQVAKSEMREGASVVTTTGGVTYTGQYRGLEDCPNYWSNDTWECVRFELSSDGGGVPFTGEYWSAVSYGVSRMAPADGDGTWILSRAEFGR